MAKQESMNLIQFQKRFTSEVACHDHLFTMKWPKGFNGEKCGHGHYYETTTRKLPLYECKNCRYQATITVGTVMERTRTDLTNWLVFSNLLGRSR